MRSYLLALVLALTVAAPSSTVGQDDESAALRQFADALEVGPQDEAIRSVAADVMALGGYVTFKEPAYFVTVSDATVVAIKFLPSIESLGNAMDRYGVTFEYIPELQLIRNPTIVPTSTFGGPTITDETLSLIKRFDNLESIDLSFTEISDAGVQHLKGLRHLRRVNLAHTKVTDAGLAHLRGLPLEELCVAGLPITEKGVASIARCTRLKELDLSGTPISDAELLLLADLKQLENVNVTGTNYTYDGIDKLREHVPGVTTLSRIKFSGAVLRDFTIRIRRSKQGAPPAADTDQE